MVGYGHPCIGAHHVQVLASQRSPLRNTTITYYRRFRVEICVPLILRAGRAIPTIGTVVRGHANLVYIEQYYLVHFALRVKTGGQKSGLRLPIGTSLSIAGGVLRIQEQRMTRLGRRLGFASDPFP